MVFMCSTRLSCLLLIYVVVTNRIARGFQIAKPHCQEKCGNISIPYPFGTTEGCSLNRDFLIKCNTSTTHSSQPFLLNSDLQVLNISLDGEMRIFTKVIRDCYTNMGLRDPQNSNYVENSTGLGLSAFHLSNTRNKFVTIGCDALMLVSANQSAQEMVTFTGCISVCFDKNSTNGQDGSCSGNGCCEAAIPKGVYSYDVSVFSFYNHTYVWDFNPCTYTFLGEAGFNYSSAYLSGFNQSVVPTVVDWAVGNQTCKESIKNPGGYASKSNYTCLDSPNGPGYRCKCPIGFEGNPYLADGCQDIDECKNKDLNNCAPDACNNTMGSFTCVCPKGHSGDGLQDNKGCTADQSNLLIKIIVGIGTSLLVLVFCSSWLYWGYKKKKLMQLKHKFFKQNGGLMLQSRLSQHEGFTDTAKIYTVEELEKATDKYHESRIVGQGGFGIVYKGILHDGKEVAIKKSKLVDKNQIEQFINEVVVLYQINHRNVVRLLDCCLDTEVPLLVYEFISNGTLFDHIHNHEQVSTLSWNIRVRIAAQIAGVLAYLHSVASPPIIHRDIKSTNILLDENYVAKVSDFGASRLVPIDHMELSTLVQGTLGYLDPEYLLTSQLTEKSDVYSFGVVVVELLTGKKPLCFDRMEKERSLANFFLACLKEDRLFEILEQSVVLKEGKFDQIKEVANVAKKCLSMKGEDRPDMQEVAMELEGLRRMIEKDHRPLAGGEAKPDQVRLLIEKDPRPLADGETNSDEVRLLIEGDNDSSEIFTESGYDGLNGIPSGVYDSIQPHVVLPVSKGR